GRVEPGAVNEPSHASVDGKPAVALVVSRSHTANPRALRAALTDKLSKRGAKLPAGVQFGATFDFTANLTAPDKGPPEYLLVEVTAPAGASAQRVFEAIDRCAKALGGTKGVRRVLALSENPFDRA